MMSKKKKRKTPKLKGKPVIIKKELPPPKTIRVYKVGEASEFKKPMDMGLSYTDCLRRSYKASSPKTGSNNENEISTKAGISSSKTVSPTNSIMDISKYKMHIYISGLNTLEGISIVKNDNLAEGYFFVSDLSALSFLTSHTYNNGDKIATIKSQVNKKFVTVKSEVSFVNDRANAAMKNRSHLCQKIKDAIKQKGVVRDEEKVSIIKRMFKYESRLDFSDINVFLDYLYKTDSDSIKVAQYIVEDDENQIFSYEGVRMQGTREKAKLISYPQERADDLYDIPPFVDEIVSGAFTSTNNLESIKIGEGVRIIGKEAFVDNTSLVSITVPKNVAKVQEGAFTRCTNLRIAIIRSKKDGLSPMMFVDCPLLETLVTNNESLRNCIGKIGESSKSSVKLVMHKRDKVIDYPYLKHDSRIIVMGNIYNCIKQKHRIESVWVNVQIKDRNGFKDTPICVFYCRSCRRYFVLPDIYEYYLMRYDFKSSKLFVPLLYSGWYDGPKLKTVSGNSWDMKERSILREMGYNVNATEGLSQNERLDILRYGINHGIVTKHEVEQYLEFFIKFQGAKFGCEEAYVKWKSDLIAIHKMNVKKTKYWDN